MANPKSLYHTLITHGQVVSETAESTCELGREFATRWTGTRRIALTGPLGAGKTQFTKGLALGLGLSDTVTSPTFTLAHEYGNPPDSNAIIHFDLYRLDSPDQLDEIGIDDALDSPGWIVVEWADKFPGILPPPSVAIHIEIDGPNRKIILDVQP